MATQPIVFQGMSVANADALIGSIPDGVAFGTVSIILANTSDNTPANCKIYVGAGNAPELKHTLDAKSVLEAGGGQTFSCVTVLPGEKIWVRSDTSNVAVQIRGLAD